MEALHEFCCTTARCYVCLEEYMDGGVIRSPNLERDLPAYQFTGGGMCPEHAKMHNAGFIALVEIDMDKSRIPPSGEVANEEGIYRTGKMVHMDRGIAAKVLSKGDPASFGKYLLYVRIGMIDALIDAAKSVGRYSDNADDLPKDGD